MSVAQSSARSDGGAAALDVHEGLSDIGVAWDVEKRGYGCPHWPHALWLLSSQGERVAGRCHATNQCDYCAKLAAVENTEMLALDAMEGDAPEVWLVLTTRTSTLDMSVFYEARQLLMRALRREFAGCEYASLLEYTTGYGANARGRRRPHWNVLLKGVRAADVDRVRAIVERIWCPKVDAKPDAQYVGEIADAGGLMQYVAQHFQKESQAPPKGFRGQRFNCSRGYFTGQTRAEAREQAKLSLWEKRQLRRAVQLGLQGDDAEDYVDRCWRLRDETSWRVYHERGPDRPAPAKNRKHRPPAHVVAAAARAWLGAEEPIDANADRLLGWAGYSDRPDGELSPALPVPAPVPVDDAQTTLDLEGDRQRDVVFAQCAQLGVTDVVPETGGDKDQVSFVGEGLFTRVDRPGARRRRSLARARSLRR